jgi:hypothetical protein
MAVSRVKEIRRYEWQEDADGNETAVIEYEILVDSYTTSISTILAHADVPDRRSAHPENANAVCVSRSLKNVSDFDDLLMLTATFSTKPRSQQDNEDPLSMRIKGGMRSASQEVPAFYDAFGNPLVNDAGDLYEGLTKKQRLRQINVTTNYAAIPNYLFDLAETINAAAVTIHGKTYPAGTCYLSNVQMPDEPIKSKDGVEYWPITYDVEVNPSGYYIILPNKGFHELIYQTRSTSTLPQPDSDPWVDATKAAYDAEGTAAKKQVIKRRIQTSEQQDTAESMWLDYNGQATRVISLNTSPFSGGAMTAGSATLTVSSGLTEATHKGCLVIIPGAGPFGRKLEATITAVASGTSCTLSRNASTTVSGKSVYIPGARFKTFVLEDLADWSSVPLPNNEP